MTPCKKVLQLISAASLVLVFVIAGFAQSKPAAKPIAYAIQVESIDSKVAGLPAEFSAAIYENLLDQIAKSGHFAQVYRSGDKRAADAPKLLVLRTTVEKFQEGSETTRAVTTVGGSTHVYVHMQLIAKDGKSVAEKDVEGTVRFFGENLTATKRLASSIAKLLAQTPVAD